MHGQFVDQFADFHLIPKYEKLYNQKKYSMHSMYFLIEYHLWFKAKTKLIWKFNFKTSWTTYISK